MTLIEVLPATCQRCGWELRAREGIAGYCQACAPFVIIELRDENERLKDTLADVLGEVRTWHSYAPLAARVRMLVVKALKPNTTPLPSVEQPTTPPQNEGEQ